MLLYTKVFSLLAYQEKVEIKCIDSLFSAFIVAVPPNTENSKTLRALVGKVAKGPRPEYSEKQHIE